MKPTAEDKITFKVHSYVLTLSKNCLKTFWIVPKLATVVRMGREVLKIEFLTMLMHG